MSGTTSNLVIIPLVQHSRTLCDSIPGQHMAERSRVQKTCDWAFRPSEHPWFKVEQRNDTSSEGNPLSGNETVLKTNAGVSTLKFPWQTYSSFEKHRMWLPTPCVFHQRTKLTAPLLTPVSSNMHKRNYSTLCKQSFSHREKGLKNSLCQQLLNNSTVLPFHRAQRVLRATRRIEKHDVLSVDAKDPIVLGRRHPVARLFVENLLRTHCHQGVDYLRALVQHQIAIVKLRIALRTIALRCVTCPKCRAVTLSPRIADLQRERIAFKEPPFANTGVDFFGPFYVSVTRSTENQWGFLFNLLTTIAVHFGSRAVNGH